ncbi:MAG: aminomethyl-transferring glycine dehydrogenase subunit GcvPA [Verrucomicrobiales bacterium]|nr:aminomethyl-transferring glycine dehydrogenase subunit GcvPA [Verrucomicrobiales bacterium]
MASLPGYNVLREQDRSHMLEKIGVDSIDQLIDFIPANLRLQQPLDLPVAMSEWQLKSHLTELASQNESADSHVCFLGGGVYDHHIPAVVDTIASRGEFLTAYTPYQPEISQGLLRVLSDFQLVVGRLFDVPVVNCSVYDGATALAESAWMAISASGENRLIVSDTIWPEHLEVLHLYMANRDVEIEMISHDESAGTCDLASLESALQQPAAAVIAQSPNCFGILEDVKTLVQKAHQKDCLAVIGCYPTSLGIIEAPGTHGADIVYAEGQSLGLPLAAGGPYMGMIGTREALIDFLPGRLVGETKDIKGEPALALIKQEREQHVRRHKATSHICSNQALMALRTLVYLSLMGESGLRRVATLSAQKAHYLCAELEKVAGISKSYQGAFFNEFCIDVPVNASKLIEKLRQQGFHAGIECSSHDNSQDRLLIAVTETKSLDTLNHFIQVFTQSLKKLS